MQISTERRTTRTRRRRYLPAALLTAAALAVPSAAAAEGPWISPTTIGAGTLSGKVGFDDPVPAVGEACAPNSFDLEARSTSVVLNTVISGHLGNIQIAGRADSECESAIGGSGTLAITQIGNGPTGSGLRCPPPGVSEPLIGTYTRTATAMSVSVTGECWINRYRPRPVTFRAEVAFAPAGSLAEIGGPMTGATIDGAFYVEPPEESPVHPENIEP